MALDLDTGNTNPNPRPVPTPNLPPSTGVTPPKTPQVTPPRTPSSDSNPPTPDSDTDLNMSLKERSVFFPPDRFDGRNKNLTKQHWQRFEDFCNQQKFYIEDKDHNNPAVDISKVEPFFLMTLTDLARAWAERQNFITPKDMKDKFLIDEFLEKFEDLAQLNNVSDEYKLHVFKIAMPRETELHLRSIENLHECYQTARELLTIVQNPVTNKMLTLSLAQSRLPSPQPRTRSTSPRNPRPDPPDRSRSKTRNNFDGFKQYPGPSQPQSIMKRPYQNTPGRVRGRGRGRSMYRSRSVSKPRWNNNVRCFNCNMVGHFARDCFTRTSPNPRTETTFQKDYR